MNQYLDNNMARLPYGNTIIPTSTNPTTTTNDIIRGRIIKIEETTAKIIHFAHENEEISGPRRVAFAPTQRPMLKKTAPTLTPFLKKIAPREIQISHHEFDGLRQATKEQIIFVYGRTMGLNTPPDREALDSHSKICQALRFLGVGMFEYDKNSRTMPDDLLTNWVHEWNKLFFDRYEENPDTIESLKEQASRRLWDLDHLKAITARWMQGKDEDKLLEPGRKLMKIDDEARLRKRQQFLVDERKTRLEEIRRREMQNEEGEKDEEVIREELMQEEAGCNTGSKMKLDAKTLEMINGIKEAHDAVARRTARLLAHVMDVRDFTDCPRLPRNRRLEGPQPVSYPWINTKTRGRK